MSQIYETLKKKEEKMLGFEKVNQKKNENWKVLAFPSRVSRNWKPKKVRRRMKLEKGNQKKTEMKGIDLSVKCHNKMKS